MTDQRIGYPEGDPDDEGTLFTPGWQGSPASHERAIRETVDGTKAKRETYTLTLIDDRRSRGITVKELRDQTGWHHGQASSVLSTLHKAGKIDRLVDKRDRCHIYVTPAWVAEREAQSHGHRYKTDQLREAFEAGWRARDDYSFMDAPGDQDLAVDYQGWRSGGS